MNRINALVSLLLALMSAPAVAADLDVKQCKQNLVKAKKLDMLYDVRTHGPTISILVGPTFFKVPIDAKEGFAATVACVLGDGKNQCYPFELQDWRTGKRIGRWSMCKLVLD